MTDPLAAEIKRLRTDMGMTLAEWAAHVKIPEKTLHGYETGRITPPANRLLEIIYATRRLSQPFQAEKVARALVRSRRGPRRAQSAGRRAAA